MYSDEVTPYKVDQHLGIYLDSDVSIRFQVSRTLTLFRYSEAVTYHSPFTASVDLPVSHCCVGTTKLDLWNATLASN